jgi:hypothetical protein
MAMYSSMVAARVVNFEIYVYWKAESGGSSKESMKNA